MLIQLLKTGEEDLIPEMKITLETLVQTALKPQSRGDGSQEITRRTMKENSVIKS